MKSLLQHFHLSSGSLAYKCFSLLAKGWLKNSFNNDFCVILGFSIFIHSKKPDQSHCLVGLTKKFMIRSRTKTTLHMWHQRTSLPPDVKVWKSRSDTFCLDLNMGSGKTSHWAVGRTKSWALIGPWAVGCWDHEDLCWQKGQIPAGCVIFQRGQNWIRISFLPVWWKTGGKGK